MDPSQTTPEHGRVVDLTVAHKVVGMRLDQYLVNLFADFSRSLMQKAIEAGSVTVNDATTKASYKIRLGDKIRLSLPEPSHDIAVPEDIPWTFSIRMNIWPSSISPSTWWCTRPRGTGAAR